MREHAVAGSALARTTAALAELSVDTFLVLCMVMPVYGALVRLRATYAPRPRDDSHRGKADLWYRLLHQALPRWSDVLDPIQHTKQQEGWRGLYRGTTLAFVQIVGQSILAQMALPPDGTEPTQETMRKLFVLTLCFTLVELPFEVGLQRTQIHPHRLGWWRPLTCLEIILSPSEYRTPWRIYTLPGLLPALLLRKVGATGLTLLFQWMLFPHATSVQSDDTPSSDGPNVHTTSFSVVHLLGYVFWNLLVLAWTLPLDCMITRLATQMIDADYTLVHTEDGPGMPEPARQTSRVQESPAPAAPRGSQDTALPPPWVMLHPPSQPYSSLFDCCTTMLAEEGPESLTRGAGVALISLLLQNSGAPR